MKKILILISVLILPNLLLSSNEIALIIGNEAYSERELDNPVNDANSLAAVLENYGYEVYKINNVNKDQFYESLELIKNRLNELGPQTTVLFYFAGHGFQFQGNNYLLPVEANIRKKSQLIEESVKADEIFRFFNQADKRIVILDVCRNEFLESKISNLSLMGEMVAPKNTLLAFSTQSGELAIDSGKFRGVYAQALVHNLRSSDPEMSLKDLFNLSRKEVMQRTNGTQRPLEISTLEEEIYLKRGKTRIPPDRYFYGLDIWRFNCPLSFNNISLFREIEIDPSQSQIRTRLKSKKESPYKNWSQWNYFSLDSDKNYHWDDWVFRSPKDSNLYYTENGFFSTGGNFLESKIKTNKNSKEVFATASSCDLIPIPSREYKLESYLAKKNIVPKENIDLREVKRNLLGQTHSREQGLQILSFIKGIENLSLSKQAHYFGVLIKDGKLSNNLCFSKESCSFKIEKDSAKAYDLLVFSLGKGNLLAALDVATFYKDGIIVNLCFD